MSVVLALLAVGLPSDTRAGELSVAEKIAATNIYDGFKGWQNIRTDPATIAGVGYVHPAYADLGAPNLDHVAIGTANGLGSDAFCPDDYDAKWSIYVEWSLGGVFTCHTITEDVYGPGTFATWQITWSFCESVQANRWVLTWAGVDRWCVNNASHAAIRLGAGLETTGASNVDRNLDIWWMYLRRSSTGSGNWDLFGSGTPDIDPNYTYSYTNDESFRVYLAPWN